MCANIFYDLYHINVALYIFKTKLGEKRSVTGNLIWSSCPLVLYLDSGVPLMDTDYFIIIIYKFVEAYLIICDGKGKS